MKKLKMIYIAVRGGRVKMHRVEGKLFGMVYFMAGAFVVVFNVARIDLEKMGVSRSQPCPRLSTLPPHPFNFGFVVF